MPHATFYTAAVSRRGNNSSVLSLLLQVYPAILAMRLEEVFRVTLVLLGRTRCHRATRQKDDGCRLHRGQWRACQNCSWRLNGVSWLTQRCVLACCLIARFVTADCAALMVESWRRHRGGWVKQGWALFSL